MNTIKTSLLGLTAAVVLGVSSMAVAAPQNTDKPEQHMGKRAPLTETQKAEMAQKHLQRRYGDLNLSQAQLKKIESIEAQYREQIKNLPQTRDLKEEALHNRLQQLQQQRLSLLQSKQFDAQKAQQWQQEQQQVRQQLQLQREQHMARHQLVQLQKEHAIFQVFTAKQQQQYLEHAKKPFAAKKDGDKKDKPHDGKHKQPKGHHGHHPHAHR